MGRKSRHYRDESDPLLGFYSQNLAATSSVRNASNPLYSSEPVSLPLKTGPSPAKGQKSAHSGNMSPLKSSLNASLRLFSSRSDHTDPSFDMDLNEENKRKNKTGGYRVHRVSYTAQNHVQVLFQMYGSAFPNVLPFCIVNVLWTFAVEYLKNYQIIDLTFHSSIGHSFMGLLVSFLIVSRSKISYDRFMQYRTHLATSYRACREIAQFTTVYTFQTQTPEAKYWRNEVCFRTILLLRVTMDALLWSSTERDQWVEEYFKLSDRQQQHFSGHNNSHYNLHKENGQLESNPLLPSSGYTKGTYEEDSDLEESNPDFWSEHYFRARKLSHGRRSNIDEHFRAPITNAHVLRRTIMEHPDYLGYKMPVNEYRDLLNFVTIFTDAFHGFRVLVFTPYPFPLVQMSRAFLFFWVYTLPMVLLKEYRLWSSLLIVVLVSFGFVGIEYVSIALDDPFSDDTNDVDEHGMALLVYEDIYLAIYRTDGPSAAFDLRERVLARYKQGRGLDCYRDDLKGYDIWERPLQNKLRIPTQEEPENPHSWQGQNDTHSQPQRQPYNNRRPPRSPPPPAPRQNGVNDPH